MAKFIEVKDAMGEEALIDPLSVQAVEQIPEENKTIVYFTGRFSMELTEPYEELKHKLNEALEFF